MESTATPVMAPDESDAASSAPATEGPRQPADKPANQLETHTSGPEGPVAQPEKSVTVPKTPVNRQSVLKPETVLALLREYFAAAMQKGVLHSYYNCSASPVCSNLSKQEAERIKTGKEKTKSTFQHKWLCDKDTSFSPDTGDY